MITDFSQLDLSRQYTYADYLTWHFQERVELLRGWVSKMSPAPSSTHQRMITRLMRLLPFSAPESNCEVFTAPFDVTLPDSRRKGLSENPTTVVQPDISVICDRRKIKTAGCFGAPDWIIEVLSPGNSKKEMNTKFRLYEEAGVREYWILDSTHLVVTVFDLAGQQYQFRKIYAHDEVIPSGIFPECQIDLKSIFLDSDRPENTNPDSL